MSKRSIVLAAAAAALLVTGASPARAADDFWNGFEDQAGRMLAVEAWRLGHVVAAHSGVRPTIVIERPVVVGRPVVVHERDRHHRYHRARRHAAVHRGHRHARHARHHCRLSHREAAHRHAHRHHGPATGERAGSDHRGRRGR